MGIRGRTSEKERRGGGVREDDGGWKDVKKRGDRGRGEGITHESCLLFSQLFFPAP